MKKIQQIICTCLILALILGTFSGCGNNGSSGSKGGKTDNVSIEDKKFLVNPEDYRGTSITYCTWTNPDENEDGPVIDAFEEKYGITVNIDTIPQYEYISVIASRIAAGNQGDIFFETGQFPGCLSVCQPLDNAMINFDDPIWNKAVIDYTTIDGHPYFVDAVSNVWSEADICIYNKKIFEDNNITTPAEYYEAGKWNYDTFLKACKEVKALGKEYTGAAVIGESALGSAGTCFFSFKDNKIVANINDRLYETMTFWSQALADGLVVADRQQVFDGGKCGMALTNCFALKRTGLFTTINPDYVAATYLPTMKEGEETVITGLHRAYGLIKGAKNPVAAGIFLREYLDVNNYNLEQTFLNEDVKNFFFQVTGRLDEIQYHHDDDMRITTGYPEKWYYEKWKDRSPAQVRGYIESELNVINEMVRKANDLIETERKWLKENYQ